MTNATGNDTDELASLPSITADRDDWPERKSSSGPRRKVDGMSAPSPESVPQIQKPIMIMLRVLVMIIVIGATAYLYDQLKNTQQSLLSASARIELLEARLASTDTTMTKSEVLLSAKIKSMDGLIDANKMEIRKLSGSTEKNTKSLQLQNSELQQQKSMLESVTEQARQTASQVVTDGVLLKNVDSAVKEAVQRMEIAQENINDLSSDAKSLKDKQMRFETDTARRVTVLEDTAKSTDVFRRNTLDELRRLREELSRQQVQSESGIKPVP